MKITLTDAGKRFNLDWIFRHLSYTFIAGRSYAITGPNGSGKSTLLQVIAGSMAASEGKVEYEMTGIQPQTNGHLPAQNAYRYLSFSAPYMELVEEMTVTEFLSFHQTFKPFISSVPIEKIIDLVQLKNAAHKQIRYYSSGMKQRVQLAQAIFSSTPAILLDEPCTNLDADGIALYRQLVKEYGAGRLIIVSSNDIQEYDFCEEKIDVMKHKDRQLTIDKRQ